MSLSPVKLGFVRRGLAGGNNPDHRFAFTIAVANHHEPKMETKAKQKESILPFRMFVIIELRSKIVIENGLRFLKRYAVIRFSSAFAESHSNRISGMFTLHCIYNQELVKRFCLLSPNSGSSPQIPSQSEQKK
jgi:hypothetical protein